MLQRIERGATWIGAILMPALALVVLYNVLARAFFSRAPNWPFEVSIFMFGILALLAGGQVLHDQGHVAVDILPRRAGPRLRQILHVISMLVIIVVCIFVVIDGSIVALDSTMVRERSVFQTTFNPEIWWFRWMIPIGAALILLEALRQLIAARKVGGVPAFEDEEIEL